MDTSRPAEIGGPANVDVVAGDAIGHASPNAPAASTSTAWASETVGAGACPVEKAAVGCVLSAWDQLQASDDPEAVPALTEAEIAGTALVALP